MHRIIYDTDPGIDDAMALLYLNALRLSGHNTLLGITTVGGNATIEQCTSNALFLCESFEIDVGVYRGASHDRNGTLQSDFPDFVHGPNGLGGTDPVSHTRTVESAPAADFIAQACHQHPGQVTLLAVGKLTNIANALAQASTCIGDCKDIIIMGGAWATQGNVTPCAEANIFGDPEAASEVFASGIPLTMISLDVTMQTVMTPGYLQALCRRSGSAGELIREMSRTYAAYYRQTTNLDGFPVHDSSAVAYMDMPEIFNTLTGVLRCELTGEKRGQTVFTPTPDGPHRVCSSVDSARILERYASVMTRCYGAG